MRGDHLADGVGVDEADIQREGNHMLAEDGWVEVEVDSDQGPSYAEGKEAEQGFVGVLFAAATGSNDVLGAADGVEDEHNSTVDHVPVGPSEVVDL